jgi:transcriptional repressor NrdR
MNCPYCQHPDSRVVETRESGEENALRRRRECTDCDERFTTYERVETSSMTVIKSDGAKEAFKPEKMRAGIERSCKKRPVSGDEIDTIVDEIESEIKARGESTIESREIGDMVIEALKQRDEVAYLRYASVYNEFDDASSFEEEAKTLRTGSD